MVVYNYEMKSFDSKIIKAGKEHRIIFPKNTLKSLDLEEGSEVYFTIEVNHQTLKNNIINTLSSRFK